jgi:hypothetical protein
MTRCTTTPRRRAWALGLGLLSAAPGCGDDSPPPADDATAGSTDDSTPDTDPAADSVDESGAAVQDCDFQESFDVADGEPWPAPWSVLGGVALADVQGGRGRLVPVVSGYSLARIGVPLDCVDVEATFAFEFTDGATQGVGFYVRQNGGYLQATTPVGLGYAAFAENFRAPVGIGAWREIGGSEQQLEAIEPFAITPGVVYRVRLRVTQDGDTRTQARVRIWRDGDAEPDAWQVERTDATPELQRLSGGIAVDAWSSLTSGQPFELYVDDIVVTAAP